MPVAASPFPGLLRRLGAPAVGLLGAVAVCVACSSTTGGTPAAPSGDSIGAGSTVPSTGPSLSIGNLPTNLPVTPSLSLPAVSDLPSIGGSGSDSAFCSEFNPTDLSNVGASSDPSQVISEWDKLTADAPAEIKPDFQKVDDFLHAMLSGNTGGANQADLGTAAQHIGVWFAQHCSGG